MPRINRTRTSVSNALFETPEANSTSHRPRTASISIVTHSRLAQGPRTAPLRPTRSRGAARCPPAAIGANWCRQPKNAFDAAAGVTARRRPPSRPPARRRPPSRGRRGRRPIDKRRAPVVTLPLTPPRRADNTNQPRLQRKGGRGRGGQVQGGSTSSASAGLSSWRASTASARASRLAGRRGAGVYMGAVLMPAPRSSSSRATRATTRRRASPAIQLAVRNDEELNKLLGSVTIASGGVLPNIHAAAARGCADRVPCSSVAQ